jgi:hypothetical protein
MSKYIVTAYKSIPAESEKDVEVVIDLKEVTELNPQIGSCTREGEVGVFLIVNSDNRKKAYAYFILLEHFAEFIAWDLGFKFD